MSLSSVASQDDVDVNAAPADPPKPSERSVILDRRRKQNPQRTIDEFWKHFTAKTPGQVSTVLPNDLYAKRAAARAPKGAVPGHSAVASYEEAATVCRAKVDMIVAECRRVNQKYSDAHFDIEIDLKWGPRFCLDGFTKEDAFPRLPRAVKRVADIFEDPVFYKDGASAEDIRQGRDGDCWFIAALCTASNKDSLIPDICVARDEAVGVYGFVFHRDGEWISTTIDDKLYLTKPDYDESFTHRVLWDDRNRVNGEEEYRSTWQSGSGALYFAQCRDENETWLPLLEKAYAKVHGDYSAIEGGYVGEALEDLTGGVTSEVYTSDILDREKFWNEELTKVNEEFLFGCSTGLFGGWGERKGIVEGHAYSIMKTDVVDGERLLLLRNPWGDTEWNGPWSDGSKEWTPERMLRLGHRFGDDGAFWMSYKDLLRKFQAFDRTRLMGPDWSMAQQWTSLNVPWSVDYHDTKFAIQLKKRTPMVIVLSQLDNRYFKGLEGQYSFELLFRLHKEGEEAYIVRSHGKYRMSRSVSAEVELDEGRYSVLIKVTAIRDAKKPHPDEVIRKMYRDKRDKILQIGLSYDLAHAKGQFKESEEEKKARELREAKAKEAKKLKRKEARKAAKAKERARMKRIRAREKRIEKKKAEKRRQKEAAKAAAKHAKSRSAEDSATQTKDGEQTKIGEQTSSKDGATKVDTPTDTNTNAHEKKADTASSAVKSLEQSAARKSTDPDPDPAPAIPLTPPADPKPVPPLQPQADTTTQTQQPIPSSNSSVRPTTTNPSLTINGTQLEVPSGGSHSDIGSDSELDSDISVSSEDSDLDQDSTDDDDDDDDDFKSNLRKIYSAAKRGDDKFDDDGLSILSGASSENLFDANDEFATDPWNAVCIVALRIYSKDKEASVEVVRPKDPATESGLDLDDVAKDATKDATASEKVKAEEKVEEKPEASEKPEAADRKNKEVDGEGEEKSAAGLVGEQKQETQKPTDE
ncbi:MAG: hypothetical protein M1825_000545 [Sarcosagium campestre]|nr:MAG: hypothetical protein M1825_000545 [Sarcosagium campestre]